MIYQHGSSKLQRPGDKHDVLFCSPDLAKLNELFVIICNRNTHTLYTNTENINNTSLLYKVIKTHLIQSLLILELSFMTEAHKILFLIRIHNNITKSKVPMYIL